jgi:hypothetical protein
MPQIRELKGGDDACGGHSDDETEALQVPPHHGAMR